MASRMNQINIPIPDWAKERDIVILAGNEPFLIYLRTTGKWYTKVKRCDMCGKCCTEQPETFPWRDEKGNCKFLKKEVWNFPPYNGREVFICTNSLVPFACIYRNPLSKPHPDCCIEYEGV